MPSNILKQSASPALVLRSQALCLASNAALARLAESTMLTRVCEVGILLCHGLGRVGHLACHVLGGGLEVGGTICCGLGGGVCWATGRRSLGGTLVLCCKALGFGGDATCWWLTGACYAGLARLQICGVLHGTINIDQNGIEEAISHL